MRFKIIILNLTEKLNDRFQERLSELSLYHHMDQVESESLKNNSIKHFDKVIKKHLDLLHMNDEVKTGFTPGPMVSFWEA